MPLPSALPDDLLRQPSHRPPDSAAARLQRGSPSMRAPRISVIGADVRAAVGHPA